MAESLVKNTVCAGCGADVRPDTLFCYNCGDSVAPDVVMSLKTKKSISETWFREQIGEDKNGDAPAPLNQTTAEDLSEAKTAEKLEIAEKPIVEKSNLAEIDENPIVKDEPQLKSAAAMRRKPKNVQPKKVEVIWEEYENAPNLWFIGAALVLIGLVALILYLATALK